MDELTSRHMTDNIAVPGDLNSRPFGYESFALTNCAITAYDDDDDDDDSPLDGQINPWIDF